MKDIAVKLKNKFWLDKVKKLTITPKSNSENPIPDTYNLTIGDLSYFKKLTQENTIVEYTVLLTVFNILIYRFFEGRRNVISKCFSLKNKLLFFSFKDIKGKTIRETLEFVKEEVKKAYENLDYDETVIQEQLFNQYTDFNINYELTETSKSLGGFQLNVRKIKNSNLELSLLYDSSSYPELLAEQFLKAYRSWLIHIEKNLDINVFDIPLLNIESQKKTLAFSQGKGSIKLQENQSIHGLFEAKVIECPNAIAIKYFDRQITYGELNERANRFANYLETVCNVQVGDLIGVKVERNELLPIVLLGILKCGAAYVPIDIDYPNERIIYIENDSNAKIVVDQHFWSEFEDVEMKFSSENPPIIVSSFELAYVIYTSGTTGNPKGVMITHQNALSLILWAQQEFCLSSYDIVHAGTSHCFDLSVFEIFYTLSEGKPIRILNNSLEIKDFLSIDQNILINTVPSVMRNLLDENEDLTNVKVINLAGEAFPVDIAKKLQRLDIEVRNLYGPSEDTTYSTCYKLENKLYETSVPIGKPITNTCAYVLGESNELLPVGVVGRLFLSGEGVTAGYLGRMKLTMNKFVEDPFVKDTFMYDTGDLVKWNSEGNLEYLGRIDNQVKLRGYRIELGEIEKTISDFSDKISQVVVDMREKEGHQFLVCYYINETMAEQSEEIQQFLLKKLPKYMIPSHFISLESMPFTPNGKIDRNKLKEIQLFKNTQKLYVEPTNEIEQSLVLIWQNILGIEKIGVTDRFFDLGGHSLMISQVINQINKQLGKSVQYKLFYKNPTIKDLAQLLEDKKANILTKAPGLPAYPLTPGQERLWLLSQLEGGDQAYIIYGAKRITGDFDIKKIIVALEYLYQRHESLRTSFYKDISGNIKQIVLPYDECEITVDEKDFSNEQNISSAIEEYVLMMTQKPVDLSDAPLCNFSIIKVDEKDYIITIFMHHIIGDGWSLEILMSDLVSYYQYLLKDEKGSYPNLPIQFKDYAYWLHDQEKNKKLISSRKYWEKQLSGEIPILKLPNTKKRPLIKTYLGKQFNYTFTKNVTQKIESFAKKNQVTLFTILMGGLKMLFSRYSGQSDIILGTVTAGRDQADIENLVGMFVNTLPIRSNLQEEDSFNQIIDKEQDTLLKAYTHASVPFDTIVQSLSLERDASRSPLFDVLVVLQNQKEMPRFSTGIDEIGFEINDYKIARQTAQFDLTFNFEHNEELSLEVNFNTDLYDEGVIKTICTHLENLLVTGIQNPNHSFKKLSYLTHEETQEILNLSRGLTPSKLIPKENSIHRLFENQATIFADAIAVIHNNISLTYKELNEKANQLAHYLQKEFLVGAGDLVGVKVTRNQELPGILLAVLKSGAAYVPIDINYPKERIDYIENDSKCKLLIDEAFFKDFQSKASNYSVENIAIAVKPQDVAYIIYTSGTTGNPKGVVITHHNAVSMIGWAQTEFSLANYDIVFAGTSYCFDLSIFEMFYTLSVGKTIRVLKNSLEIKKYLSEDRKILINTVPSTMRDILEEGYDLNNVNVINLAGEAFPVDIAEKLLTTNAEIRNLYGPSEDTTYSTCYQITNKNYKTIPIGRPIANTSAFVLGDSLELLPIGSIGTLYLSGFGVAKGYLGKTEITKERFVLNPYQAGEVMYNTGDLVRWMPDGELEYLGRKDHQVKLRGYRIELEEIEQSIYQYSEQIEQVVVDVKEVEGQQQLIGYYLSKGERFDSSEIRAYLFSKLPAYMVPNVVEYMESFPLTPNGKIDKQRLPNLTSLGKVIEQDYVAPQTTLEIKLAAIWKKLLKQEEVSMTDDFFQLGGHSLLLTKLINEYRNTFEVDLDVSSIYFNTRAKDHAQIIKETKVLGQDKIQCIEKKEYYEVSPSQLRFWMLYELQGKSKEYNIYSTIELPGNLNNTKFESAFNVILERHEILRTSFINNNGTPKQRINECAFTSIPYVKNVDLKQVEKEVFAFEFDLENDQLYQITVVQNDEQSFLLFNIHHSIGDGWSLQLICHELLQIYHGLITNTKVELTPLSIQYKDYAYWQNQMLTSGKIDHQLQFWKNKLSGTLPYLELPSDYSSVVKNKQKTSSFYRVYLDKKSQNTIAKVAQKYQVSMFSFFAAALKVLVNRITGENDMIIGIPAANRNHYQLHNLAGCFINTIALRNQLNTKTTFKDFLRSVNRSLMEGLANQNYPFEYVLEELDLPKENGSFPLSSVFLNLLDFDTENEEFIKSFETEQGNLQTTPKFDFECYVKNYENGLAIDCVYDSSLFKNTTVSYWIHAYLSIIDQIVTNPSISIDKVQVFKDFLPVNDTVVINNTGFLPFDKTEIEQTIISRFKKQVSKTPDSIAVQCDKKSITYQELDTYSSVLANKILNRIDPTAKRIALYLPHNYSAVIGMLAVLKAGCSYVPIDPEAPINRVKFIIEDSKSAAIICSLETDQIVSQLLNEDVDIESITFFENEVISNTDFVEKQVHITEEAYVLYTSGSTGKPKGVVQSHRNVLHYIRIYTNSIQISPKDRLSLFSTYTFDASVKDIYGAILNGGTVNFYSIATNGLNSLANWIEDNKISIIHMVPTLYRYFLNNLQSPTSLKTVRIVDMGGEACYQNDFKLFKENFSNKAVFVNDYGPTESTIVLQKFISHQSDVTNTRIPLGIPVSETEVYLLDENNKKVRIYEEGEIVFKSNYLALGYLNRKELTEKVFTTDPVSNKGRIYRSGDIGRLLPNGEIEFIRRKDTQIKLNGIRIELSEIEFELEQIDAIEKACVLLKEVFGKTTAVAYLQICSVIETQEIKQILKQNLPKYMIPSIFMYLDDFPKTRTGKIDRNQLPIPTENDLVKTPYKAPESDTEKLITKIWGDFFKKNPDTIGVENSFFDLGGNSLKAITMINIIKEETTIELSLKEVFENDSIKNIARLIEEKRWLEEEVVSNNELII